LRSQLFGGYHIYDKSVREVALSVWILLQIAINIVLFLGVWMLWTKFRRPPKDDPRLSRGLQLLQSKIAVLEDLSDKTETQVKQLATFLDRKCKEVQKKIHEANEQMNKIDSSMEKSLDVAKIFEDRIPHKEIIERQRTKAYVKAAQLAHKGMSIDEIAERVDISRGELEMIVKVNKDRLMFSEDSLPAWAKEEESEELNSELSASANIDFHIREEIIEPDMADVFKPVVQPSHSLQELGEEFRKACEEAREQENELEVESQAEKLVKQLSESTVNKLREFSQNAKERLNEITILDSKPAAPPQPQQPQQMSKVLNPNGATKEVPSESIKKFEFPKIDVGPDPR
jgi:transposase